MNESCRACGAALADDQRYCLNCGERQGGPRVDFRAHLEQGKDGAEGKGPAGAAAPAPAPPGPPAGDGGRRQRDYAPLAAAGGIAVLGVMLLLIGVLIGRGTGSESATSAPPQVVTVSAAEAGGEAGAGGEEAAAAAKPKAAKGGGAKKAKGKAKASNGGSADTGDAPVASKKDQLRQLQEQSPEEYSESSAKLPNEIATPGAPPPTDGKSPGGGSGGTTIE